MTTTPRRCLLLASLLPVSAAAQNIQDITVVGGPGNDYQAAVVQPWQEPDRRIAVFERLVGASASGDLWLTRSDDDGQTWSEPVAIVTGPSNERHASLVQTGEQRFVLFYLSNASGGFRIHRAESDDGDSFTPTGAIDLGWPIGGEVNPQVSRDPDGRLLLVYQRLNGAAHIAASDDDGLGWDKLRTQISPGNAALPRLARRDDDGRYLLMYQTGGAPVTIWARTSTDPFDWSDAPVALAPDGNNHDPWPIVMPDGRFVVLWARVADGAFQIHSSHSPDGRAWSEPLAHTQRLGLANIQPYALPTPSPGRVELYWGAAQVPGDGDYDIVMRPRTLAVDVVFADGFEADPDD